MSKSDKDIRTWWPSPKAAPTRSEATDDAAESEEEPTDDVFGGGAEFGVPEEDDADEDEIVMHDADAEDAEEERERLRESLEAMREGADDDGEVAPGGGPREMAELMSIIEALVFVSDEPLTVKAIADVLKEEKSWVQVAVESLASEFNERNGGLMLREVAGGWQLATRPEHHEHVRAFLKSKPARQALARRARNARRHRLQAARHRPRDSGDSRRHLFVRHQDAARQAPHHRQRAQGDGRAPDDVRHLQRVPHAVRPQRFGRAAEHRGLRRPDRRRAIRSE